MEKERLFQIPQAVGMKNLESGFTLMLESWPENERVLEKSCCEPSQRCPTRKFGRTKLIVILVEEKM